MSEVTGEETDISMFSLKERNWIIRQIHYIPYDYDKDRKVVTVLPRYPADTSSMALAVRDVKWQMNFVPMTYRSLVSVPHDLDEHKDDDLKQSQARAFRQVAVRAYWMKVEKIMRQKRVDILAAREILHATGTLPKRTAEREAAGEKYKSGDSFWHAKDYTIAFMLQFEDWQQKTYDMQKVDDQARSRHIHNSWALGQNRTLSVAVYCGLMIDEIRTHLPQYLLYCGRKEDAAALIADPLWGDDAKFEVESDQRIHDYSIKEKLRVAQSHEHIQQIDSIIRKGSPSIYSVHYPWGPYGESKYTLDDPPREKDGKPCQPYHTFPNCLALMADGSILAKLEVLDTDGLNRYALRVLTDPWWGVNRQLGDKMDAWEGEYDFDFPHFTINIGDEFDHAKLIEVLSHGIERIGTRDERKYGSS